MHPAYLMITKVVCNASDDTFGADDLYGVLGNDTFTIGQFQAGDQKDITVERLIPPGVNDLTIAESDFPDQGEVLNQRSRFLGIWSVAEAELSALDATCRSRIVSGRLEVASPPCGPLREIHVESPVGLNPGHLVF
ncbi:hypothetical protein HJC10_08230 [Corallococcus exiguus]|nr:hypothetical protein [Corallococcus exiguus]